MADKELDGQTIRSALQQFDAEAFRDGLPFVLLGECGDDLTQARAESAMRERAKTLGLSMKEFDSMLKAAKSDLRRKRLEEQKRNEDAEKTEKIEQAMNNGGQITGLADLMKDKSVPNFGEYICTDRAVMQIDSFGRLIKVCAHPLFPTKRYINIESGNELIDLSYKLDGVWKTAKLIDRKTISQARMIPSLSGIGMDITSENAGNVVKYLAEVDNLNRDIIPKEETISRLGWVDGRGFSPYIDGVVYDAGGRFADAFSAVHKNGSYELWRDAAAEILLSKSFIPARLVLAASVASVLLKWTCSQPFFVHVWSPESGSGKTITMMLAASVWADPGIGKYVLSMNSTAVAFEQMDSFCNNLPLIYDELQSANSNMDTEKIIYAHGEGTGRVRGAKDGGLREQSRWLNIAITSGEQPLSFTNKAGAINRVISIEANGHLIPGSVEHMSDYADTLRENYGFIGKSIVDRIQRDPHIIETVKSAYRRFAEQLSKEATGKQANYAATLMVGDALLSSVVFGEDASKYSLTPSDILPFLATSEMVDINLKIKSWLCGFVASETAYFIKADSRPTDEVRTQIYGKKESDDSVLFIYERLKEELEKRNWAYSSFMRWCNERQYIKTNYNPNTARHYEIGRTIEQIGHVKVIHFLPSMFHEDTKQTEMIQVNIDHPF